MRLLLAYARHRGLFILRIEDAEHTGGGGEWDEVLKNPRINRESYSRLGYRWRGGKPPRLLT